MKLKKAIKYHEEMADQDCYEDEQLKNAKIHATYAGWLRELKWRRKQDKEMPLVCIKCKKPIPISYGTMQEISYTHYFYCEDCLRKALKSERRWKDLYRAVHDHFYEILKMEPSEAKRAKVSLANWMLDIMTKDVEPEEEEND